MDGGWWCCCRSCTVAQDDFDYGGIFTGVGGVFQECPDDAQGNWWLGPSTRPQHDGDGALYELSGDGLLLTRARESTESQYVQYNTIDEEFGNRYQIWLKVAETDPRSCNPGAALMVEFYCGNGSTIEHSLTAYSVAADGTRTTLGTKKFNKGTLDIRYGRVFSAQYIAEDGLLCAGVSQVTGERASLAIDGVGNPGGHRIGVGNDSDDALPIEIDDFLWLKLDNPNAAAGTDPFCFACICKCQLHDEAGALTDISLFAKTLYLRMQGSCCGTSVDVTVPLVFTWDALGPFIDRWIGSETICGVEIEFRLQCEKGSPTHPQLYVCPGGSPSCFSDDTGPPDGPVEIQLGSTCDPVNLVFLQEIASLNTHPCCGGCSSGSFTYTITE